MAAPLYGLVLTGGRSTRMQRDKATLEYCGHSQLAHAMSLLAPRVVRSFVSVRADQATDAARREYPQILDRQEGIGPIAGILAAQAAHPDAAWLVLACDLPFLDGASLDHLIARREPQRSATAYRSAHDGLPEPLCAIYEPGSHAALEGYVAAGKRCPRKFLVQSDAVLLDQPNAQALDNINTPEEYAFATTALAPAGSSDKHIRVQYYALLREQAGRSDEALLTRARTPRELYAELNARHPFTLAPEMLRVAVNAEFGEWSQPLADGDAVVFIPPVAGG
jgi:molybdopterin-guanine dinucleotide biosynthesis protein A